MFTVSWVNSYRIGDHTRILTLNPVHLLTGLETVDCHQETFECSLFLSASDLYILGDIFYLLGELSKVLTYSHCLIPLLRPHRMKSALGLGATAPIPARAT